MILHRLVFLLAVLFGSSSPIFSVPVHDDGDDDPNNDPPRATVAALAATTAVPPVKQNHAGGYIRVSGRHNEDDDHAEKEVAAKNDRIQEDRPPPPRRPFRGRSPCDDNDDNDNCSCDTYHYEAPEPFEYLHDCCDDCNPAVPESPDPLVAMTWTPNDGVGRSSFDGDESNNDDDDDDHLPRTKEQQQQRKRQRRRQQQHERLQRLQKLQIYRIHRPVAYRIVVPNSDNRDLLRGDNNYDSTTSGSRRNGIRKEGAVVDVVVEGAEEFFAPCNNEDADDDDDGNYPCCSYGGGDDDNDDGDDACTGRSCGTGCCSSGSRTGAARACACAGASLRIYQNCTLILDWGVERAAWMELLSPSDNFDHDAATDAGMVHQASLAAAAASTRRRAANLSLDDGHSAIPTHGGTTMATTTASTATDNISNSNRKRKKIQVLASISEFNEPYPDKTRPLTKYGNHTYRLETNPELYEGVRFSFLQFIFPSDSDYDGEDEEVGDGDAVQYVEITDLSLVAKIKPVNYTGSFASSDPTLTEAWYTGAYGVRLNMEEDDMNSVLVERGDRVAIQGDGHPSIDAALVAFSPYGLIRDVLNQTDSSHHHVVDDNIMAYPLYWCLSAIDYYMASGDVDLFVDRLAPDIMILLDKRIGDFLDPRLDITWFGWDDRLGNGWCFHSKNNDTCTDEALWSFAGLVIRVCKDLIRAIEAANMGGVVAQKYERAVASMTTKFRHLPAYPDGFGVHAVANAINAGIASPDETDHWLRTTLNDAVTICSFSQFNQYWILQAFGNIGTAAGMEYALASIKLCWGPMLKLGKGCFWEVSSPEWLRFMKDGDQAPHLPSYCHPWSSGVTPWLSHVLGGLQPVKPGYEEFVAMPYVSTHYRTVSSTIGTPNGPIIMNATLVPSTSPSASVGSSTNHSTFYAYVECTPAVEGMFGLRRQLLTGGSEDEGTTIAAYLDFDSILLNGEKATVVGHDAAVGRLGDVAEGRLRQHIFVRLEGTHKFIVTASYVVRGYNKATSSALRRRLPASTHWEAPTGHRLKQGWGGSPFPQPRYPGLIDSVDRLSQGDGLLQYGDDGYVLLGWNEDGRDLVMLPPYISSVTLKRHGFPGWLVPDREFVGSSDSNPIYLPVDPMRRQRRNWARRDLTNLTALAETRDLRSASRRRALGMVGLDDGGGGDINCILIDVKTEDECAQPYSLSVYFVGLTAENRHVIRVMDGTTLNVVAPTTLVNAYENGIWWTLHYNCSVRLKLMDIKGIHVSAVAFSSRKRIPAADFVEQAHFW
jgi:hypothetical protein